MLCHHNQKLIPALVSSFISQVWCYVMSSLCCWNLVPEDRVANKIRLQSDTHVRVKISRPLKAMIESVSVFGPIGHVRNEICPRGYHDEEWASLATATNVEAASQLLRRVVVPVMPSTWTKMLPGLYRQSNCPSPSQAKAHDPVNLNF